MAGHQNARFPCISGIPSTVEPPFHLLSAFSNDRFLVTSETVRKDKRTYFRSLTIRLNRRHPSMFSLQILPAAQLERPLNSGRIKAGIKAARAQGTIPGNPDLHDLHARAPAQGRQAAPAS
jgi:hypothetical protein